MTASLNLNTSVGRFASESRERAAVLKNKGIDPSWFAQGLRPLAEVCREKGLDPMEVLHDLLKCGPENACGCERDWNTATLTDLAEHIVGVHHGLLRREIPRLERLLDTVVEAHGRERPELPKMRESFARWRGAIEGHMNEEERMLFPIVRLLEGADRCVKCGTVGAPFADWALDASECQHDRCDSLFAELKEFAGGFAPPADACPAHRRLFEGFAALEADMVRHESEEHNVLFRLARMLGTASKPADRPAAEPLETKP